MKPEAQRIAIAEVCGWTRGILPNSPVWWKGGTWVAYDEELPSYLTDLNAMHEAEKVLTDFDAYKSHLTWIVAQSKAPRRFITTATAAQRAEAFLRTIGKWEESS